MVYDGWLNNTTHFKAQLVATILRYWLWRCCCLLQFAACTAIRYASIPDSRLVESEYRIVNTGTSFYVTKNGWTDVLLVCDLLWLSIAVSYSHNCCLFPFVKVRCTGMHVVWCHHFLSLQQHVKYYLKHSTVQHLFSVSPFVDAACDDNSASVKFIIRVVRLVVQVWVVL